MADAVGQKCAGRSDNAVFTERGLEWGLAEPARGRSDRGRAGMDEPSGMSTGPEPWL